MQNVPYRGESIRLRRYPRVPLRSTRGYIPPPLMGRLDSGHGRTAGCPAAPAQIPASGTTAPGSCLRSDAQSLRRVRVIDTRTR